jgi:hypothetical protein
MLAVTRCNATTVDSSAHSYAVCRLGWPSCISILVLLLRNLDVALLTSSSHLVQMFQGNDCSRDPRLLDSDINTVPDLPGPGFKYCALQTHSASSARIIHAHAPYMRV